MNIWCKHGKRILADEQCTDDCPEWIEELARLREESGLREADPPKCSCGAYHFGLSCPYGGDYIYKPEE